MHTVKCVLLLEAVTGGGPYVGDIRWGAVNGGAEG